jgi:hypothetical protein
MKIVECFNLISIIQMDSFRQTLFQVPAIVIVAFFFAIIYFLNWLGYRVRERIDQLYPDKDAGIGAAEGALLGLMALLLAFSFSLAATKFENRRQAIVDEANIMNTAILQFCLYPDSIKQRLLPYYKQYLESRIQYFEAGDNPGKIDAALIAARTNFGRIWSNTVQLGNNEENRIRTNQLIPVLISMNNIVTTREAGRVAAVPTLIVLVLLMLIFISSFLTGFGIKTGHRNPVLSVAFAFMTSAVLYLVLELGRPREGYINLENAQQMIVDLRKLFA